MRGENGDVACDGYHKYKVNTLILDIFLFARYSIIQCVAILPFLGD